MLVFQRAYGITRSGHLFGDSANASTMYNSAVWLCGWCRVRHSEDTVPVDNTARGRQQLGCDTWFVCQEQEWEHDAQRIAAIPAHGTMYMSSGSYWEVSTPFHSHTQAPLPAG